MSKLNKYQNEKSQAFTLIELVIVVSILGILAAIVLPEVQGHTQQAKESAAKDNLRLLRNAIERYAVDHNGIPPGYNADDPTDSVAGVFFKRQLTFFDVKYLNEIPENPFNEKSDVTVLGNADTFPETPDDLSGWTYQPLTKTIKINASGSDSTGKSYFEY